MYNPANVNAPGSNFESRWEWIEVHNPTANDVYLHTLYDSALDSVHDFNLFFETVPPGETIVIGYSANLTSSEWNLAAAQVINLDTDADGPRYDNSPGDTLYLFGSDSLSGDDAQLLDVVAYGDGNGNDWPAQNYRSSIYLMDGALDPVSNDTGSNWCISLPGVNGAVATMETLGPPPDADEGSPGVLPSGPCAANTAPGALGDSIYLNDSDGTVAITVDVSDADGDPLGVVIEMLPSPVAPTTLGSGGNLSDPNAGAIGAVPYTLAANGKVVEFTPNGIDAGVYSFGFRAYDGTDYSGYAYVTIYIQDTNSVVITEIMDDPQNANGYDFYDSDWEYVEIYNPTGSTVQLGTLWDDGQWSTGNLSGQSIPSGAGRVITRSASTEVGARTTADFAAEWGISAGDIIVVDRTTLPYLNNGADDLYLFDSTGRLLDVVRYADGGAWPTSDNQSSIFLFCDHISSVDNDSGANWRLSLDTYAGAYESAGNWPPAGIGDIGSPALVQVPPSCGNYPPEALDSRGAVAMNSPGTLMTLAAWDDGYPSGTLTFTIETLPVQSTTTSLREPGSMTPITTVPWTLPAGVNQVWYTPPTGYTSSVFAGDDTFDYSVSDGAASSALDATCTPVVQKGGLVISEIMYDPRNQNTGTTFEDQWEWVEVRNTTGAGIILQTLTDDDGEDDGQTEVATLIPAGAVRVITQVNNDVDGRTQADFLQEWYDLDAGSVIFIDVTAPGGGPEFLGNSGDRLQLIDDSGNLLDDVLYGVGVSWPAGDGASSIYVPCASLDALSNDDGANWLLSQAGVDGAYQTPTTAGGGLTDNQDVGSPGIVPGATVTKWASVRDHDANDGSLDLRELVLDPAGVGVDARTESRRNGPASPGDGLSGVKMLVITFDQDVTSLYTPGVAELVDANNIATTFSPSSEYLQNGGTELVLEFLSGGDIETGNSTLPDRTCLRLDLSSVITCLSGDTDVMIRSLTGDVAGAVSGFGNGTTNATDSARIRQAFLDSVPPTGDNVRFDVNVNGQTNQTDASLVRDIAFSGGLGVNCPSN
jgi:hypothetical protein